MTYTDKPTRPLSVRGTVPTPHNIPYSSPAFDITTQNTIKPLLTSNGSPILKVSPSPSVPRTSIYGVIAHTPGQ